MRELDPKAMLAGLRRRRRRPALRLALSSVDAADVTVSLPGPEPAAVPATAVVLDPGAAPEPSAATVPALPAVAPTARVLLVTNDRRFRAVTSALLSQRGYTVAVSGLERDIAKLALRQSADVVLIDATDSLTDAARIAAKLASLPRPVAIVAVSADPQTGLVALPVLEKWVPFDVLLSAIAGASAGAARDQVA